MNYKIQALNGFQLYSDQIITVFRSFYENEENSRRYLPAYEAYDRNQMRKMTHLEYFASTKEYILFDYMERNPLNQEARVCIVESV